MQEKVITMPSKTEQAKIEVSHLDLYYGENHALKDINMKLYGNCITAFIGPSGCGKSTYLKTLNRMNDLVPNLLSEGRYNPVKKKSRYGLSAAKPLPDECL